jgi:hypothetical protein
LLGVGLALSTRYDSLVSPAQGRTKESSASEATCSDINSLLSFCPNELVS